MGVLMAESVTCLCRCSKFRFLDSLLGRNEWKETWSVYRAERKPVCWSRGSKGVRHHDVHFCIFLLIALFVNKIKKIQSSLAEIKVKGIIGVLRKRKCEM